MSAVASRINRRSPTPAEVAEESAEALRTLNHLTLAAPSPGAPGWEDVCDVYRVLGELRSLADRVPQVCDQLAGSLQHLGDRAAWRTDDGTSQLPDEVVAIAIAGLVMSRGIAEELGGAIAQTHCAVAHLSQ
jgi:hypothetical protein